MMNVPEYYTQTQKEMRNMMAFLVSKISLDGLHAKGMISVEKPKEMLSVLYRRLVNDMYNKNAEEKDRQLEDRFQSLFPTTPSTLTMQQMH